MDSRTDTKKITNLICLGSGVAGIAEAGAYEQLEKDPGSLLQLKRVGGDSSGALLALLIALGYSSKEIVDLIMKVDFSNLADQPCLPRLYRKYSLYKGDKLSQHIKSFIKNKLGHENA